VDPGLLVAWGVGRCDRGQVSAGNLQGNLHPRWTGSTQGCDGAGGPRGLVADGRVSPVQGAAVHSVPHMGYRHDGVTMETPWRIIVAYSCSTRPPNGRRLYNFLYTCCHFVVVTPRTNPLDFLRIGLLLVYKSCAFVVVVPPTKKGGTFRWVQLSSFTPGFSP
jgi:hypothetical protein